MRQPRCCRRRPTRARARRRSLGQGLVEFAVISPMLLVLILGVFDLSRFVYSANAGTAAARSGARAAIIPGATLSSISAATQPDLAGLLAATSTVTVFPDPSTLVYGSAVTVTVSIGVTAITPLADAMWGGGPLTLTESSEMVVQ